MGATVYQSERVLRKWGIKGQELARITRQLKNEIKEFEKAQAYMPSTGEISTVGELKHELASERAKRGAETRRLNRQSEQEFWTGKTELHLKTPQLGEIAYSNVYDEFISKLQTPVAEDTVYGSKRKIKNIKASEEAQNYLQAVWNRVSRRESASTIGERLNAEWDMVSQDIELILISSDGNATTSAMHRIAKVLEGRALTMEERQEVEEQNAYQASWDERDSTYE